MKIVIDIEEAIYKECIPYKDAPIISNLANYNSEIVHAVANGTPLPKGHGRLIILSENKLKENQINLDSSCQKWISEVGLSNATVTIIKADKAESGDKEDIPMEYFESGGI